MKRNRGLYGPRKDEDMKTSITNEGPYGRGKGWEGGMSVVEMKSYKKNRQNRVKFMEERRKEDERV